MMKHVATVAGVGVAIAFVALFFMSRTESKGLNEVAPRVGMTYDELMSLGPRVASQTGATLGSSRRVVYLLACSGQATRDTLESQATEASKLAQTRRLSDREAVTTLLAQKAGGSVDNLKGC